MNASVSHASGPGPRILYGAGGHGKVVLDAARSAGLPFALVLDDAPQGEDLLGTPLQAAREFPWDQAPGFHFVVGVGDNAQRARLYRRLLERGGTPLNIIHRSATVSPEVRLGRGNVILGGVVINPGAVLGDNCIINTAASVDHDCRVDSHAHVCPGVHLAGNVTVGEGAMVGLGSATIPGVKIGAWSVVGAGSVIAREIPNQVIAFGAPARVKRPFPAETTRPSHLSPGPAGDAARRLEALVLQVHQRNGGSLTELDLSLRLLDASLGLDSLDLAEVMVAVEREFGVSPYDAETPPATWADVARRIVSET